MNEKNLFLNISLGPQMHFNEYGLNYLRYEITKISGKKYFRLSSGWELWI